MVVPSIKSITQEKSIGTLIIENKEYIYPVLCYVAGLITASFIYSETTLFADLMQRYTVADNQEFIQLLLRRLALYFSVYSATVLMGLCLIGFPFINFVPLGFGFVTALRIAYYYCNSGVKGFGFVLLMVAPEAAAFVTILIYSIRNSTQLSKHIYDLTTKKSDGSAAFSFKNHLKKYAIDTLLVMMISFVNAGAEYLLGQLIRL